MSKDAVATSFAHWLENGEEDPFGDSFQGEESSLCMGHVNANALAKQLLEDRYTLVYIGILTGNKERLRWLSRKLYNTATNYEEINIRRAQLLLGEYTDDELANRFFLSENPTDLKAGQIRIHWLLSELELLK